VNIHEKYMKRCLVLAKKGLGSTRPNPMVGCVIVHNEIIIGEGFTSSYGGNHAEVNAIESVKNKNLLSESTLYVSLEPCSHFGKTPPCADLIVNCKIKNVVIGALDDNHLVSGKGVARLEISGSRVVVGVLEKECRILNKRFFTYHNKKRPFVILKWAETKDGFMDRVRGQDYKKEPNWISNEISQQLVHKWRAEEQAVLVGTNTVINDNPRLNVRRWSGENPTRLVLDNSLRIPHNYRIFDGSEKTIVFTSSKAMFSKEKDNIILEYIDYSKSIPKQICDKLVEYKIQSVIVEGGAQILQSFIYDNLWDEARIFIGTITYGEGLRSPKIKGIIDDYKSLNGDILKIMKPIE